MFILHYHRHELTLIKFAEVECGENAFMNDDGECQCDKGYDFVKEKCIPSGKITIINVFRVYSSITETAIKALKKVRMTIIKNYNFV